MTNYKNESYTISCVDVSDPTHPVFNCNEKRGEVTYGHGKDCRGGQIPDPEFLDALEWLKQDVLYAMEFPVSDVLDERRIKIKKVKFGTLPGEGPIACSFVFQLHLPQQSAWTSAITTPEIFSGEIQGEESCNMAWDEHAMDRIRTFYDCCLRFLHGKSAQQALDFDGGGKTEYNSRRTAPHGYN